MHRRKSWNTSGVSEVIGTILILAMTVVLFSAIIVWVSTIPTPQASIRLDLDGTLIPIYDNSGSWAGANVTVQHRGGETLEGFRTSIFYIVERSGSLLSAHLRTRGQIGGVPYGIDGPNVDWDAGETWSLTNYSILQTDRVSVTVVDDIRSLLLWNEDLVGPAGIFPPLFVEKWADRLPQTPTIDTPQTNREFTIFARVADQDGDLNRNSVFVYLAFLFGTPEHRAPQKMFDDGTNGDAVSKDGLFTAKYTFFKPTSLSWDGGVVIFNGTDMQGHKSTSRMTLSVIEGPPGNPKNPNPPGSGRPPNLDYNGLQGFNIFNGTEWDDQGFNATDTRVFTGNEEVVVIVGSAILKDTFGRNDFRMWDPFASQPTPVVYGPNKQVRADSIPSSTQAFDFLLFTNGYNVWIYRFQLNNASISAQCTADGGVCFKKNPAHPPEYFFAVYSVEFDLIDFLGNHFTATDAITVKDPDGTFRNYPQIHFYSDSGFTQETNAFNSTDSIWIAISMLDVDANTDSVSFGTVQIRDFIGGTQVLKAFVNERDANPPLCPVGTGCTSPPHALSVNNPTKNYRFRVNLSLADQDPWVEGSQHYSLSIAYVTDVTSNERYADVSGQLLITAPLFRLDVAGGNPDTTGPAWGTHDYGYYYENLNGADKWRKSRFEYCGLPGTGNCKNANTRAVAFIDGDQDGDLDIAASVELDNNNAEFNYYRRSLDFDGNVVFSKFILATIAGNGIYVRDIEVGDLTGDGFPEIVCGLTNGELWYFKNDGTWTSGTVASPVRVDTTRAQAINGVTVGDFDFDTDRDIAVARAGGTVTYYANLDGRGTYSTGGITDRWFADQESLQVGQYVSPDYQRTLASDDVREEIREANHTENVQTGSTTNPTVDAAAAPWTYSDWESGAQASGAWQNTGGNPNGLVYVQMNFLASQTVSGFWYQSFAVTGSPPYAATVSFDYKVSQYGAGTGNVRIYVFVDKTAGAPSIGTEVAVYTEITTTGWLTKSGISVPSSRIPSEGTYFLKIAARTTNGAAGSTTTVQFDNARLAWQSTGGNAGELLHYWRIQQLPNRPSTSFSLRVEGHRTVSTDGDTFLVSFSQNVLGNDPTTGTYKNVIWLNATGTDTAYTYSFNASENTNLPGDIVWLRMVDTDHVVGNVSFDTARIDHIFIEAVTQSIPPGASIALPTTPGDATSIDADDQDGDGYWDVIVGTANSKVYKLVGYSGGLQAPGTFFHTAAGGAITGIKFASITTTSPGLEVVLGYSTRVRVIDGEGASGAQIGTEQTTTTAINTLGAGDVDGDGDDDVVVGTATTASALVYFRNFGNGLSWGRINIEPIPSGTTIAILDLYLGDGNKSQYMGR